MGRTSDPADAQRRKRRLHTVLLILVTVVVLAGAVLRLTGRRDAADLLWAVATAGALVPTVIWVFKDLRRRRIGVDIIAVLALAGALLVGEYLAGAVVALMLATGQSLEAYAENRASRDLRELLRRAPRSARRRTADGGVDVVALDDIRVGDRLLIGPGDAVGTDGVLEDEALLDTSVVTGESQPVAGKPGDSVASGVVNAGAAFGVRATATATESTYAGIVRLAEEATARKAPMVRLADRYAAAFVPFTLLLAGVAWLVSGELRRAVAVLVVATPCPLLLATPIAIVAGLSRAARVGVVIRDGSDHQRVAGPAWRGTARPATRADDGHGRPILRRARPASADDQRRADHRGPNRRRPRSIGRAGDAAAAACPPDPAAGAARAGRGRATVSVPGAGIGRR